MLKKQKIKNIFKSFILGSSSLALFTGLALYPQDANACCYCTTVVSLSDPTVWQEAEDDFDDKLDAEFKRLERFLVHQFWEQSILPVMMLAAEQFTVVAVQQAMIVGTFIDANNQMEAQLLMQEIRAKAHKDYHPSEGLCEFGSLVKSVAASERRSELTSVVLSERTLDRQLGNVASLDMNDLKTNRIQQFMVKYCNAKDRASALNAACTAMSWETITADQRKVINRDIDFYTQIDNPWTLKIDFTNNQIVDTTAVPPIHNEDEEHVLALSTNLFSNNVWPRLPPRVLTNYPGQPLTDAQIAYMDMRSIIAKRNVAENSFNAITAMKAEGNVSFAPATTTPPEPMHSRIYMENILKELGVPATEILTMLGDNPSYYAQMEILTKKIFQSPDFYTNLYDKPANVDRKTVSLQAIKLMQKFDILKSSLRSEASFSILLELAVSDLQREIEDSIHGMGGSGSEGQQ